MPHNISDYEHLIGKRLVADRTPHPLENTFRKIDLPEGSRILPFGAIITMDYVEDRLNVLLDDNDVVIDVNFG